MTTSTNETTKQVGGAFADALTLIRFLLTPVIMYLIITGWPGIQSAALITVLFIIAALTDVFDDMTGGAETARQRKLGWFDDIADLVLIFGCLIAMLIVVFRPMTDAGMNVVPWIFVVPAVVLILRDIVIAVVKGGQFRKYGLPETKWGTARIFLTMLGVLTLLAAPWITQLIGGYVVSGGEEEVSVSMIMTVWIVGSVILTLAAILSLVTAYQLLTDKSAPANDG